MNTVELLAPAGDFEKLKFAFHYGADAVYLAGQRFGLRAFAGNFPDEELVTGIRYAHEKGKKVYVTMNAYPHNPDLEGLTSYARFLEEIQADAILVADPGVYWLIRQAGVKTPIHISTQATIVNWAGIRFWEGMEGVERVVLARELSLAEIKTIQEKTCAELEVFVHGAMCMSYSGRCLLSNYLADRDANQGACAQPCRWRYALVEEKRPGVYYPVAEDNKGSYIFNSHDLSTLAHLEDIIATGVQSLKIEGRMKSVFYLSTVVRAYRNVLDAIMEQRLTTELLTYWEGELEKVSHRPYTSGFLYGRPEDHAINPEFSEPIKPYAFCGVVLDYNPMTQLAKIEQRNKMVIGDKLQFFGKNFHEMDYSIEKMYDENMQPITEAPHAQEIIYMPVEHPLECMDILRKAQN